MKIKKLWDKLMATMHSDYIITLVVMLIVSALILILYFFPLTTPSTTTTPYTTTTTTVPACSEVVRQTKCDKELIKEIDDYIITITNGSKNLKDCFRPTDNIFVFCYDYSIRCPNFKNSQFFGEGSNNTRWMTIALNRVDGFPTMDERVLYAREAFNRLMFACEMSIYNRDEAREILADGFAVHYALKYYNTTFEMVMKEM